MSKQNGQNRGAKMPVVIANKTIRKKRIAQPKTTVSLLNEIRPGLCYKLESQTGDAHYPLFTISVEIDGQKFVGKGRNKKDARADAAAKALRDFLKTNRNLNEQLKNNYNQNALLASLSRSELVTVIEELRPNFKGKLKISEPLKPNNNNNNVNVVLPVKVPKQSQPSNDATAKLNELFKNVQYNCTTINVNGVCRFKMSIIIDNDKEFFGFGTSKKFAKKAAAKAALAALCNISYSPMKSIAQLDASIELPQLQADTIGRLVMEKFLQLMRNNATYAPNKVLAGIVMTEHSNFDAAQVIAVATGTKCISGEYMSLNGATLNDSHAEIIARRCLKRYLFEQLELHCSATSAAQSIFIKDSSANGRYKLKSSIAFHLYINTAPCGDARIFSPHEIVTNVETSPQRKIFGLLRTKIESGEGTIPSKHSVGIQTWDGVLQGERLLTMSCSDKIARWNVLGIQGALLASIIEPIYLHSIVLGSLLHPLHMYRAIYGRLEEGIKNLPQLYQLNKPFLAQITSIEPRSQAKSPSFGINWTMGDDVVEVVTSMTGRTIDAQVSRLTKQAYFLKYGYLIKHLPGIVNRKLNLDYGETKLLAKDYQLAKRELFAAFESQNLGHWLKKPMEQNEFTLPDCLVLSEKI